MPVYVVQGKLGTGKGKFCVLKMREALQQVAPRAGAWIETMCEGGMPAPV